MKLYLMNTVPPIGSQHKGLLDGALVLSLFLNVPVSVHFHGDFRSFFQGARNKSNTHFASVYPPDETNNSLPLLENEDIWWRENAIGNLVINKETALSVVSLFMGALEARFLQ